MKNFVLFFVIALGIFSCDSGIGKYQAGIETLGKQWAETGTMVTEFSSTLNSETSSWASSLKKVAVDPQVLAKLKDDAKAKVTAAMTEVQTAGADYGQIQAQLKEFMGTWTEKSAEVTALTEGLTAGKLEGDVTSKISELTTFATEAVSKVGGMKETFEAVKAKCAAAMANWDSVKGLLPS